MQNWAAIADYNLANDYDYETSFQFKFLKKMSQIKPTRKQIVLLLFCCRYVCLHLEKLSVCELFCSVQSWQHRHSFFSGQSQGDVRPLWLNSNKIMKASFQESQSFLFVQYDPCEQSHLVVVVGEATSTFRTTQVFQIHQEIFFSLKNQLKLNNKPNIIQSIILFKENQIVEFSFNSFFFFN